MDYLSDLTADILNQIIDHLDPPAMVCMYQTNKSFRKMLSAKYRQIMHVCKNRLCLHEKFDRACEQGHIFIAQWIYQSIPPLLFNRNVFFTDGLLNFLMRKGKDSVLNWICDKICDQDTFQRLFELACSNGCISVLDWLIASEDKYGKITVNVDRLFAVACECNVISTAKWLIKTYGQNINIHTINDDAFYCACRDNDLELAQWLICLGENGYGKITINDSCWNVAPDETYNFLVELHKRGY